MSSNKKRSIEYYNQVKLWSIQSFCLWELSMLASFFFSQRETHTLIKSFSGGIFVLTAIIFSFKNIFLNSLDYQRHGKYSTGRTRHDHVFVLRGCYSTPSIGGAPPTRSITRVRHRQGRCRVSRMATCVHCCAPGTDNFVLLYSVLLYCCTVMYCCVLLLY